MPPPKKITPKQTNTTAKPHYVSAAQKEPVNSLQVIINQICQFQVAAFPVWSAENHHENALWTSDLICLCY